MIIRRNCPCHKVRLGPQCVIKFYMFLLRKNAVGQQTFYAFSALVAIEPGAVACLALANKRNILFRG